MGIRFKVPMPTDAFWKLEEIRLARETGWTPEFIATLSLEWWRDYWGIRDGEAKADPNWKG